MATSEPLPSDKRATELVRLYRDAQRTIVAQVRAAVLSGNVFRARERRLQLAAVLAVLDQLGAASEPVARRLVAEAVKDGSDTVAADLRRITAGPVVVPQSFTGVSREAVMVLEDSILGRLRVARETVGRSVDDVYGRLQRRQAVRSLLGAEGSPQLAAKQLARDLRRRGVTGFVDAAGRNWKLDTYAEMAVRTVTREAVVQGQIVRMAAHGITLSRVSTHGSSCEICRPWEGRIVSIDGSTSEYQGAAVADLEVVPSPPYHPNCRHTLEPVVTDVEALRQEMGVGVATG